MTHGQRIQAGIGIVILQWMVIGVSARVPAWESNTTLWGAAVQTTPNLARPHVNFGVALLRQNAREMGALLLVRGSVLAARPVEDRGAEMRAVVRHELRWLAAFGDPLCSRPDVQPHC